MSQVLINQYLAQLDVLKKVGGTHRESVVREAFKDLLKGWGKQHDLVFIPEYKLDSATKDTRFVDGALLHELRVPFDYWEAKEAKDAKDDIDAEIAFKFKRGYPQDNIIFEDSTQAVLIQHRQEVMRCSVTDVRALEKLLRLFFGFERAEIAGFRNAVAQFKTDLPAVLAALREMIEHAHAANAAFADASAAFLQHAQAAINPGLTAADVREMLIQHILTEEIFSKVFDSEFHRDNNVARELYQLEATFFTGGLKRSTLKARTDVPDERARAAGQSPKCMLRADPTAGRLTLDSETTLDGVPAEAWRYRLGNRCAIDWVLDQYKEKKPKDPTIRAKFDTYRFADHKEAVIDLLARVTAVSVQTVRIVEGMKAANTPR